MPQWGKKIDSPTWGRAGTGRGSQMESFSLGTRAARSHSLIYLEKVIILFVIASKLRRCMLMASLSHANLA